MSNVQRKHSRHSLVHANCTFKLDINVERCIIFHLKKKKKQNKFKKPKKTTTAKHKTNALLDLLFFPVIFL